MTTSTYYTIELGAVYPGCTYPAYWIDYRNGSEFSDLESALKEARELGWWRIVEHIDTEQVVAECDMSGK